MRPTPHRHFARAPSPARPGGNPPTRPSARTTADFTPRLRPIGALPGFLRSSESDVDVVIPVHNEERILASSVRRLHGFLAEELPFSWRIIIADNASTDRTPLIAARLSDELTGVQLLRWRPRAAAGLCGLRGPAARRGSCVTWTPTCQLI